MDGSIIALDVGGRRVGVALASKVAKIANPLCTLINDTQFASQLKKLISEHSVNEVIVGLPKGLNGHDTEQTKTVRNFTADLENTLNITTRFQDEALSSVLAEEKLKQSKKSYSKEDIDMYAAAFILQDYLNTQSKIQEKV